MNEFERRFELLSIALGLKGSTELFLVGQEGKKNYGLLFSTYIKMINQDQNNFFIDETKKKQKIINSLQNTLSLSQTDSISEFNQQLNDLKPDDPHSFILLPANQNTSALAHSFGVVIYKNKEENYLLTIIDKVDDPSVEYRTISKSKSKDIGRIFLEARESFFEKEPFWIMRNLNDLSNEIKNEIDTYINISMQKQYIGNCVVKNIESALKIALFNCRKNIFDLSQEKDPFTPKWHPDANSTLEMRKRFLHAVKVPDQPRWNQCFDQVFEHYLTRKRETMKDSIKYDDYDKEYYRKKRAYFDKRVLAQKQSQNFAEDRSIQSLKNKLAAHTQKQPVKNSLGNKKPQPLIKESR